MPKNPEPLLYLKLFLVIILFAAAISLSYKAFLLVQESSFKHGSFNLLLLDRDAYIVHIDAVNNKMEIEVLPNARPLLTAYGRVEQSAILGVLIDGSVTAQGNSYFSNPSGKSINEERFIDLILRGNSYRFDNVNDFDILKILLYSKLIPKSNQSLETAVFQGDKSSLVAESDFVNILGDRKILDEKASVQVINATDKNGLGNKIGYALKSVGYNVVSVISEGAQKSVIKTDERNPESLSRLRDSFRIPFRKTTATSIADITIILGPDILGH